ncbi:hypothetical protein GVX82_03635 [Patescibacteria group bacterium]|jgi:hypothetical protein|nr:hypothetical protein [Patescibacteria group bacterium]
MEDIVDLSGSKPARRPTVLRLVVGAMLAFVVVSVAALYQLDKRAQEPNTGGDDMTWVAEKEVTHSTDTSTVSHSTDPQNGEVVSTKKPREQTATTTKRYVDGAWGFSFEMPTNWTVRGNRGDLTTLWRPLWYEVVPSNPRASYEDVTLHLVRAYRQEQFVEDLVTVGHTFEILHTPVGPVWQLEHTLGWMTGTSVRQTRKINDDWWLEVHGVPERLPQIDLIVQTFTLEAGPAHKRTQKDSAWHALDQIGGYRVQQIEDAPKTGRRFFSTIDGELIRENRDGSVTPLVRRERDFEPTPTWLSGGKDTGELLVRGRVGEYWLTADEQWIVFERIEGIGGCCGMKMQASSLWRVNTFNGEKRELIPYTGDRIDMGPWIPGTDSFVYHTTYFGHNTAGTPHRIMDIAAATSTPLPGMRYVPSAESEDMVGMYAPQPTFAPDGGRYAYCVGNVIGESDGLWIADLRTGSSTQIYPMCLGYGTLMWSEDGSVLTLYLSGEGTLRFDRAGNLLE